MIFLQDGFWIFPLARFAYFLLGNRRIDLRSKRKLSVLSHSSLSDSWQNDIFLISCSCKSIKLSFLRLLNNKIEFIDIVTASDAHAERTAIRAVVSLNKLRYMHCPIATIFRIGKGRLYRYLYSIVLLDNSLHYRIADPSLIL